MKSRNGQVRTNEISDLADDTALLMGEFSSTRITRAEAEQTLELFPEIDQAFFVLYAYLSIPEQERRQEYTCFGEYLENIRTGLLGSTERTSLYDREVIERTALVPQEALMQEGYRDNPLDSGHFYEHTATRMMD